MALLPQGGYAQTYPAKPVRLLIPYPPGGASDFVGRTIAAKLAEQLREQVVIDNRGGGGGSIAIDIAAKGTPDGHTLGFAMTAQFAINPALYPKLPYDPVRDFAPISRIAVLPQMLVVHPSLPPRSVKEFIAFAQARAGELNFATSGNGSGSHMAMELFMRQAKVRMMRIPYNGDGPALIDLIGGQVPVKFDNLSTSIPHVRAGRLRPLGVTSPERSPLLAEIPAISETLPGFQASIFNGMVAPTGTPPEILARIHGELVKFTLSAENRQRFAKLGVELQSSPSPDHFAAFINSENVRFSRVIEQAGLSPH